jgi:hypothetical protein
MFVWEQAVQTGFRSQSYKGVLEVALPLQIKGDCCIQVCERTVPGLEQMESKGTIRL